MLEDLVAPLNTHSNLTHFHVELLHSSADSDSGTRSLHVRTQNVCRVPADVQLPTANTKRIFQLFLATAFAERSEAMTPSLLGTREAEDKYVGGRYGLVYQEMHSLVSGVQTALQTSRAHWKTDCDLHTVYKA